MNGGTLQVYTFKDGILARLAHDLRLSVPDFSVELDKGRVTARAAPASARVDGVMHGDRLDEAGLSPKDRASLLGTMRDEVMHVGRHPEIQLEGTLHAGTITGTLTMNGRGVPVAFPVSVRGGAAEVDVELVPSRWGIPPYKALAGAIKLQDRWRVRVRLPWAGSADELATATERWTA